ncbi:MAG: T9SS type A sorting domain-containing protein [Bacteroidales bacterium]|nr:T9SS type A sorting domain-containing protein [Bacteroidales bacterium]
MKKNLLFAILCVLGLFGTLNAQVVTIDGTVGNREVTTSKNVPAFCANKWAITQQFYTAEEIGKSSGTIESVAFKTAAVETEAEKYPFTRNLEIYMSNSEDYAIIGNGMRAMSASDLVFSGDVEFAYNAWVSIDITDFEYTGKNVLICVNDVTSTNVSGGITFDAFKHTVTIDGSNANRALYKRSTSSAFDATTAVAGASTNAPVPFVQFAFTEGTTEEYQEPVTPTNFVATVLNESKVQLSWEGSEDNSGYNVYQGSELIANVATTSYTVKNLVPGEYYFSVKGANGPKESEAVGANVTIVAKTLASVTIGQTFDGESFTAPMSLLNPGEPAKLDSWVEQLYTAEEIGGARTIERVSFPIKCTVASEEYRTPVTTKEIKIYLAETTATDYANQTWTAEENLTLVFSDTDIIIGDQEWETFEFDAPFNYSGEKNLAVVVAKSADESTGIYLWHTNSVTNTVLYSNDTYTYPSAQGNVTNTRPVIRFAWEAEEGEEGDENEGNEGNEGEEGDENEGNEGNEGEEDDDTTEVEVGNFQTAFYYDFENGNINGLKVIDANNDNVKWQFKDGMDGGVNDGKGLYSGMAGGDKADDYIVTASKCSITTTSEFSFTFVPYDYYWCGEKIAFVVSEDCETFETVWSYEFSSETYDGKWQEATINLSAYAGRDLYLGLHHYGTEDGLRADNLKLYSEEPGVPSNFKATATETTVTLTWDAVYGAKSYKVYAVTTEVVEETETTVYTLIKENLKKTTFTIEGLEQGTAYSYSVTSVNEFKESKYASVVTVNTLKEEEPEDPEQPGDDDDSIEELASSFNVYPNPVNNILYIETEMNVEEVVIYDVYGRQQLTVNGQQTVDVANLNSGVYFVKVVANEGEAVKRFIKK